MDNILEIIFQPKVFGIVVLIMSVVVHEVAHGMVALKLGDQTAKNAGRLTINPIPHLDPIGSIFLPLLLIITNSPLLIGWAKPVPINPYNFRDKKWGNLKVALAGPGTNLIIALIFGLILRFFLLLNFIPSGFYFIVSFIIFMNILLAIFNLIPIPPLDGSHILFTFLPYSMEKTKIFLSQFGFFILIFLIFFFPPFFSFIIYIINLIFTLIVGTPPV